MTPREAGNPSNLFAAQTARESRHQSVSGKPAARKVKMVPPWLLLLLIALCIEPLCIHAQRPPGSECRTPDSKEGTCVLLKDCALLWTAMLQRQRVINNIPAIDFLRRSQCGFVGSTPVVCCAKDSPDGTPDATANHPNVRLLPSDCGHALTDYIVGGTTAQLGEHPWLAGLEYQTRTGVFVACGGALVSKRYILTAAHCIGRVPNAQLVSVRLGEHDLNSDPDCYTSRTGLVCAPKVQRVPVERVIPHPRYQNTNPDKHFDIGLIRLRQDVQLSDFVRPVCLPTGAQLQQRTGLPVKSILRGSMAGSQQTVAGWGRTETSTRSDVKLRVTLPVMENSRCAELYRGRVKLDSTQMCAGGQAGKDSCSGDSGGPLMTNQAGQWVVTGVVSVGPQNCGTRDQPGVYTRVNPFLPWILDNLSNSSLECAAVLGGVTDQGECEDVRLCSPAINLLREKPRQNTTVDRLLAARCGDPQAGIVHICCPYENETLSNESQNSSMSANAAKTLMVVTTTEDIKIMTTETVPPTIPPSAPSVEPIALKIDAVTTKAETVAPSAAPIEPNVPPIAETVALIVPPSISNSSEPAVVTTIVSEEMNVTEISTTTDLTVTKLLEILVDNATESSSNFTTTDISLITELITIIDSEQAMSTQPFNLTTTQATTETEKV